jgi:hypothetical protein
MIAFAEHLSKPPPVWVHKFVNFAGFWGSLKGVRENLLHGPAMILVKPLGMQWTLHPWLTENVLERQNIDKQCCLVVKLPVHPEPMAASCL